MDTDLIDMIAKNDSPSEVHSKIKDILFAKSADNIDQVKPQVTSSMFGGPEWEPQPEVDTPEAEVEVEVGDEVAAPEPEAEAEVETPTAEVEVEPETEEEKPEA